MMHRLICEGWKTACVCAANATDLPDFPGKDWRDVVAEVAGRLGILITRGNGFVEVPTEAEAFSVMCGVVRNAEDGSPVPRLYYQAVGQAAGQEDAGQAAGQAAGQEVALTASVPASTRFLVKVTKVRRTFAIRIYDTTDGNRMIGTRTTALPCLYACVAQLDQYYAQLTCERLVAAYQKRVEELDKMSGVASTLALARKDVEKFDAEAERLASGPQPEYQAAHVKSWHQRRDCVRHDPRYRVIDIIKVDLRPLGAI
jgi:hypothetical protein